MKTVFFFLIILIYVQTLAQTKIDQAKLFFDAKKYAEANKILKSIEENDNDFAEAQFFLGKISYEQKKYDEASTYFENAIDKNDKVADYYNWLGNSYGAAAASASKLKQASLAPKMKEAWEKAAKLDSKNIQARWSLIMFYVEAPGFMGGSISKAKETADEIRKINPADGHRALGYIYLKDKNTIEAEKEYIQMAKLKPEYNKELAFFYIEQKLYAKALPVVEEGLNSNPNDYNWMYMLGKISALSGMRLDKGQEALEKYLAHTPGANEPSLAGANTRLGQIYERKGNKAEAKKYFELAIKTDPKMKEAKEGLARVSK